MKLIYILLIVILFYAGALPGQVIGDGERASDLDSLLTLEASGIRSPDLYFNLGVHFYDAGKSGMATLYYLRTLALDSSHQPARQNLHLVQKLSAAHTAERNDLFLVQLFHRFYEALSINRLALLCLLFLLLTALCLHWLLHYPAEEEKGLPVLILAICGLILIGFSAMFIFKQHRVDANRDAVVISPIAVGKPGSGNPGEDVSVPEATIVQVIETRGSQVRVHLPDGKDLWLSRQDILPVQPR